METIIHPRTAVVLTANKLQWISFGRNIDATQVRVCFRYPELIMDSNLEIYFSDTDGRKVGDNVVLPADKSFNYSPDFSDDVYITMPSLLFNGIEFKCSHDFTFEFWIQAFEIVM